MSLAAISVLLAAAAPLFLLAHHVPLVVARRAGRRHGVTHLGSATGRALPDLRHLVIEAEHVLTTGHLVVVDVEPIDERNLRNLRWFAGALAHGSTDPVARAIARLSGPGRTTGLNEGPDHQLQGDVDRHPVQIGANGVDQVGDVVGTTVRVDVDMRPMGHITVADEVRKGAAHRLSALRAAGIEPVLVSASLGKPDLARIADEVAIDECHPGAGSQAVAATMPPANTGTLRALASGDGFAGEIVLPGSASGDTVVRCTSPSIDSALEALQHVRRLRGARRAALVCAGAAVALTTPLAALGMLSPATAGLAAGVSMLAVTTVAALVVLLATSAPAAE
jgi:cation transport ATPase